MRRDEATWAKIRRAHSETTEPQTRIAARYGVSTVTIRRHARAEGWPPRMAMRGVDREPAGESASEAPTGGVAPAGGEEGAAPDTPEERSIRVLRIYDLKLKRLEKRMTSGQTLTPQDEERERRSFSTLIGMLPKVNEASNDVRQARERAGGGGPQALIEAERMGRELAERIERLAQQWMSRQTSG